MLQLLRRFSESKWDAVSVVQVSVLAHYFTVRMGPL